MKFVLRLTLLALVTSALHAQSPPPAQRPTDLVILNYSWARERVPGWDKQPSSAEPFGVTMERVANEQRMQQARNARSPGATSRSESEAKLIEKATVTDKNSATKDRPRFGYRYTVRIHNVGEKTIKSVDWDYIFVDKETQTEISRRQFTSDETIKPGKQKDLSVFILSPPFKTIRLDNSPKGEAAFVEQIELFRIAYSDGSVWQKP